eukprot:539903-Prymnesium_polylepis.3
MARGCPRCGWSVCGCRCPPPLCTLPPRLPPHLVRSPPRHAVRPSSQRVCLHAVCLPEPDADSEAWDAVSAVSSTRDASETFVIRARRDLDVGAEVRRAPRP